MGLKLADFSRFLDGFHAWLVNVCRIEGMYLDASHFGVSYGEEL